MKKNIEIISLIYKSTQYLDFIIKEMTSENCLVDGWGVGLKIVANDPTDNVKEALKTISIPYDIYYDPKPNDYYMNRVYRCINYAGKTSTYDYLCFINSDMAFSDKWLTNLIKHIDGINIPCSRLVESGKMISGTYGISYDCGKNPKSFDREKFNKFVLTISEPKINLGGLYMPCIFEKKRFIESGMYPEGNIYDTGVGNYGKGKLIKSSDTYFFYDVLENKYGMKHITVFDSIVYHIQEGEKDD